MKLDKRIIEGKKPLNAFDAEEAKQFIGKEGSFTDCLVAFTDISRNKTSVLTAIDEKAQSCFIDDSGRVKWDCFLPKEWVKEPEKKYRAFSLNEFLERFKIGNTVTFRMKKGEHVPESECRVEYTRLITGYETLPENRDIPGKSSILLGGCPPTSLARLFEFYELENEYYFPTVWQPFGCLVKGDGK